MFCSRLAGFYGLYSVSGELFKGFLFLNWWNWAAHPPPPKKKKKKRTHTMFVVSNIHILYTYITEICLIFSILCYPSAFCCLFAANIPLTCAKLNSIPLNRATGPLNEIEQPIYSYTYIYIYGGFLKWGYPQIIQFNRFFHYKSIQLWGYPHHGNPHRDP